MFSVSEKSGPYKAPQVDVNPAFEEAKKLREGGRETFNFDKVVGESNTAIATQFEEDKKALAGGGELKIGENKNDKEFREMLERVTGRKQDKLKNKLDKDDYLNLMVTQLKYQDPTKPMENHEMATQLAQFNTVEQLINVNKSLTDMSNQTAQANIDKLTPYLGKIIEVNGSKMKVSSDQKTNNGSIELGAAAGSVSVLIKDSGGSVVRTLGLGEKDMGRHTIEWDGKTDGGLAAKPGVYSFEVQASTIDGKEMKVKTSFLTKVEAITDLASGGKLETASGHVEAKDVLAIRPDNLKADKPEISKAERAEQREALKAKANNSAAIAKPEAPVPKPAAAEPKDSTAITAGATAAKATQVTQEAPVKAEPKTGKAETGSQTVSKKAI
jgi:flagellar basal-body rod modification protein FlgD